MEKRMDLTAEEAIGRLSKEKWDEMGAKGRLEFLEMIKDSLMEEMEDLGVEEAELKNSKLEENMYTSGMSRATAVLPMAFQVSASIQLYEGIASEKPIHPSSRQITPVNLDDNDEEETHIYDIQVAPRTLCEKTFYGGRRDKLRVRLDDRPKRLGPFDRETKVVAIVGAGHYSAPMEILKAIFFDGHVVVYKPHPNNSELTKIWSEILQPLTKVGALSFCAPNTDVNSLINDERVEIVYDTRPSSAATQGVVLNEEQHHDKKHPLVESCGGVNPVIVVPGMRDWKPNELKHHALQIVSAAKWNGGATRCRPQVLITSKTWRQRGIFLEEIKEAILKGTPPIGSYYPGSHDVFKRFINQMPTGQVLQPITTANSISGYQENDNEQQHKILPTDFLLVTEASEDDDSYGLEQEAFCQVLVELPILVDASDNPSQFLDKAVQLCNQKVAGSLCATILVDDFTNKKHSYAIEKAISNLNFGCVSTNLIMTHNWFLPHLYWGGGKDHHPNEEEHSIIATEGHRQPPVSSSKNGHFWNLHGYENIEKSIIYDSFVSSGHFKWTSLQGTNRSMMALSTYALNPTWKNLSTYMVVAKAPSKKCDW